MQLRLKRLGDLLVSGGLLLLTAPILLIAALLIRLQDGGPVLYSQLRSGFDRKPYRIWKLRTMRVDAERHGAQWVGKSDARITPSAACCASPASMNFPSSGPCSRAR